MQWRAKVMEAQGVPKVSGVRRASQARVVVGGGRVDGGCGEQK